MQTNRVKCCTQLFRPHPRSKDGDVAETGQIVSELVVLDRRLWEIGATLKVRFMGGSSTVQRKVIEYACQWMQYANITFDFGDHDDADIRISFDTEDGSWSYIGTLARQAPADEATMNFGWLDDNTSDQEFSRVVLHEFGHALGCIHEHLHPDEGIPWDQEAVYDYYEEAYEWTQATVDNNIFNKYDRDLTQYSAFDEDSIMLYAIPNELTLGDYEVEWNTVLSETDKRFIGVQYPFPSRPPYPPRTPKQSDWLPLMAAITN